MAQTEQVNTIGERFSRIKPLLNEVQRRYWVAIEAQSLGRGGLSLVAAATGVSPPMIRRGLREVAGGTLPDPYRQRRPGGGRKSVLARDAQLLASLLMQIYGEQPDRSRTPLFWAAVSAGQLSSRLTAADHRISAQSVTTLLRERGYTLRATRAIGGPLAQKQYAERYQYLRARIEQFVRCGQPVVYVRAQHSVYHGVGERHVRADSMSAEFVLSSIRCWWRQHARAEIAGAREALLALDAEIAPGQVAAWSKELQRTAGILGANLQLCTLPPAVHRFAALYQLETFSTEATSNTGLRRKQTAMVGLSGEPRAPAAAELCQRLYRRCYPEGLICTGHHQTPFCIYAHA